jgi:hypothetical protein
MKPGPNLLGHSLTYCSPTPRTSLIHPLPLFILPLHPPQPAASALHERGALRGLSITPDAVRARATMRDRRSLSRTRSQRDPSGAALPPTRRARSHSALVRRPRATFGDLALSHDVQCLCRCPRAVDAPSRPRACAACRSMKWKPGGEMAQSCRRSPKQRRSPLRCALIGSSTRRRPRVHIGGSAKSRAVRAPRSGRSDGRLCSASLGAARPAAPIAARFLRGAERPLVADGARAAMPTAGQPALQARVQICILRIMSVA